MAPDKTVNEFTIEDNTRLKFIAYVFSEDHGLIYGACIFKKPFKEFVMSSVDINNHKNTAYNRLIKCPIVTNIKNECIKNKNNHKKLFNTLLRNFGVRSLRIEKINMADTPSPNFNETYEILDNEKRFKFGRNLCIYSSNKKLVPLSKKLVKYVSNSDISNESKNWESKKLKQCIKNFPKRYRHIDNLRDIFIVIRYDDDTGYLHYGASIYRKLHPDDRIDKEFSEKHYDTAMERLFKCPVNIPFYKFIEKNGSLEMNSEDILFTLANLILYNDKGNSRIKVKGDRIKV